MKQRVVTIKNKAGIHCRPSSAILTVIMNEFPGHKFTVTAPDGSEIELASILITGVAVRGVSHAAG